MVDIYERIYDKLKKLGIIELINNRVEYAKSEVKGFMDLHFDLVFTYDKAIIISLAHNYIQNGDVMTDPDMTIKVYTEQEQAEALTFQQASPPIFQRVYSEDGKRYNPRLKKQLNAFLNTWLKNAIAQGNKFVVPEVKPDWSVSV